MSSSLLMARGKGKNSKRNGKDIEQPIAKIKKSNDIKPADSMVPDAAHLTNPAEASGVSLGKGKKKESLSGYIFMCSSSTKYDCYRYRVFGLPMGKMAAVEKIKPGAKLFLFDFESKLLYGIYEATSAGQLNMEPAAFGGKFPVQVKFRIFKECLPLPESSLRHIIKENYRGSKFNQELNGQQISNLLSSFHPLFASSQLAPPTLSNKPLSLSMPRAVTEDQFMYTSRLLALDNQYLAGMQYGHVPPVVRPQIVPNNSFPQHVGQRTAAYVSHIQPNSDHQGLPVSCNYYVANARDSFPQHVGQRTAAYVSHIQPNSDHQGLPVSCNYYVANAQEPFIPEGLTHQNYHVANAQEPYIPEGLAHQNYHVANAQEPYIPEGLAHQIEDPYSRYWTSTETAHHVQGSGISHDQVTSLGREHHQLSLQSQVPPYGGGALSSYVSTLVQPQVSTPITLQGSSSLSSNYYTATGAGWMSR